MKTSRTDRRRVTLRYLHDGVSGTTSLVIDVEAPEEDMPHEHRRDLREMAEELLGLPLGSLPPEVTVQLRRAGGDHAHPHPETEPARGDEVAPPREAIEH